MRTVVKVAALSLAVVAGACRSRQEQTAGLSEDLKRDLAAASAPASDLAMAPTGAPAARVVSSVEMTRSNTPRPRLVATRRHTPKAVRAEASRKPSANDVVADPAVKSDVAEAPVAAPVEAPNATERAAVAVIEEPTSQPAPAATPASTGRGNEGRGGGDEGVSERGRGSGIGGLLGGIIGAVVIRGGHGGVDKCDPRTDGRRRGGPIGGGPYEDEGGFRIGGGRGSIPIPRGTFPTRL